MAIVINHLIQFVGNLFVNIGYSFENLGLAVHKGPVTYYQCEQVWTDTLGFTETMTFFDDERIYFDVIQNLFFNFIDIYTEISNSNTALVTDNYLTFGQQVGKIVSDIFLKNPSSDDWSRHNSEIAQAVMRKSP